MIGANDTVIRDEIIKHIFINRQRDLRNFLNDPHHKKTVFVTCQLQRHRSGCASAQSRQGHFDSLSGKIMNLYAA